MKLITLWLFAGALPEQTRIARLERLIAELPEENLLKLAGRCSMSERSEP